MYYIKLRFYKVDNPNIIREQIYDIKRLFNLDSQQAEEAVLSEEFTPEHPCSQDLITYIRSLPSMRYAEIYIIKHVDTNEQEEMPEIVESVKETQEIVQDEFKLAQEKISVCTNCVLLSKDDYKNLLKYKGLYLDLIGSLDNLIDNFKNDN